MRPRSAVFDRTTALALCLAFVVSLTPPCFCMAEGPASHGHCGQNESGLESPDSPCCCAGVPAGPSEVIAKAIPTPTATSVVLCVLPGPFTSLRSVSDTPAPSSHAPPLRVLRI